MIDEGTGYVKLHFADTMLKMILRDPNAFYLADTKEWYFATS